MAEPQITSFIDPVQHTLISEIIRRHSSNRDDVRDVALDGLDLSGVRTVLDLGCGFGFMSEAVARRVAPDAELVGIEACAANEGPYLERVGAAGRRGRFICQRIEQRLDWPSGSIDLVVASYALYFFPQIVPEIARVLRPEGLFLALTHTESSCRELLRVAGLRISDTRLLGSIRQFSAETGQQILSPWFGEIQRVDYRNSLTFEVADYDDFLSYLRFKLPLILPESEPGTEVPKPMADAIRATLTRQKKLVFPKDDAAFRCRCPRCP